MTIKDLIQDLESLQSEKTTCAEFKKKYLSLQADWTLLPDIIGNLSHYLDDEDLRVKDSKYKKMQNEELRKLIFLLRENASEDKLKEIHFLSSSK